MAVIEAAKAEGTSYTAIGQAAGLGRNYVAHLMAGGQEPSVTNVIKLCDVLRVDAAYILTGREKDPFLKEMGYQLVVALLEKNPDLLRGVLRGYLPGWEPPAKKE